MATTPAPLVWDFYRTVPAAGLGGIVHYYDEESQSLYLAEGLTTQVATVEDGHWDAATPGEEIRITGDTWTSLGLDHPSNGTLYGVASGPDGLTFLRYHYAMDLSTILDAWQWSRRTDSPIAQLSASVLNVGEGVFLDDASLFQPGSRLRLSVRMGDSEPFMLGTAWLDDMSYDATAQTVPISGRGTIGKLRDQTFDDAGSFTGPLHEEISSIFELAGIKKYEIQPSSDEPNFSFDPTQTLLAGLEHMTSYYTSRDGLNIWDLAELPDGTVLMGYNTSFISKYIENSYYTFEIGRDLFRRKTRKSSDAAYTQVRATAQSSDGSELQPVTVPVLNYSTWVLGSHKTLHVQAPKKLTQEQLQIWAENKAAELQYVGIGEDFSGPFRPHLLVGDVAEVVEPGQAVGTSLGLVTEVRQVFDLRGGYRTEFAVDSGGVATDGEDYVVYSRSASVSGYNRRQTVMDLIRHTAQMTAGN